MHGCHVYERTPVPASLHKVYWEVLLLPASSPRLLPADALVRSQCPMYVAIPGLAWYGYGTCVRRAPIQGRMYASTLLSRWHVHPEPSKNEPLRRKHSGHAVSVCSA
jgi:hypothetical protein